MMRRILLSCIVLVVLCFAACSAKKPAESDAGAPVAEKSAGAVAKQPAARVAEKPAKAAAKEPAARVAEKKSAAVAKDSKSAAKPFHDEPAAHALYKQMIKAMRDAGTLSYVSHYSFEAKGKILGDSTYRAWLKSRTTSAWKRNPLPPTGNRKTPRTESAESSSATAPLFGSTGPKDVPTMATRPCGLCENAADLLYEEVGAAGRALHRPRNLFPRGGMSMPIIDPSTFFGYTDSLQTYLDGVMGLGAEKVGDEDCDKIELSIMKHQRSWYLWLSKRDHLPRKLKQIVRVSYDIVMNEEWSSVTLNADMADAMFAWEPPKGWTQWKLPPLETAF